MFKKDSRYITSGVNFEIDINLQLEMWYLIDMLKCNKDIKLDYLQVFDLKSEGKFIKIEHSQEIPEYKNVYRINSDSINLVEDVRVFVIDSGDYSTMLLPNEY